MKAAGSTRWRMVVVAGTLGWLLGCGGGGGSTSNSSSSSRSRKLLITTVPPLPNALQGRPYSVTLIAEGGQGPLQWSIAPIAAIAPYVTGLTIDANAGILSGTVNFVGLGEFRAQVMDSSSPPQTATQDYSLNAYAPLQGGTSPLSTAFEYQIMSPPSLAIQGGVGPFSFSVPPGCLPPGVRLSAGWQFTGAPLATGTFQCNVTVQDSYTPPEVVTDVVTIMVKPSILTVANALPSTALSHMLLNRPFSGAVVAVGGVPPYSFTLASGNLPPGTGYIDPGTGQLISSVNPSTGQISGTPTAAGNYSFTVSVRDAASPANTASGYFGVTVSAPLGRNDTPATAKPLPGNGSYSASISPYIDPPATPVPGDNDYYKLVSMAGSTVHVETQAKRLNANNPLDTVLEIVDGNGVQLTTCRQPGDTSTNFTSACVNDDISASPHVQDSALDFQVPGASNVATTFYAHVLDWRGDARPDMSYLLSISGLIGPLQITGPLQFYGIIQRTQFPTYLKATGGAGTYTWSVISGGLPPGISLDYTGVFIGTPTATGSYNFQVQVSDPGPPAQTAVAAMTMTIVPPLQWTTTALPPGTVGVPYSAQILVSGGVLPYTFSPTPSTWLVPAGLTMDPSTGIISGTPASSGVYTATIQVTDSGQPAQTVMGTATITVNP